MGHAEGTAKQQAPGTTVALGRVVPIPSAEGLALPAPRVPDHLDTANLGCDVPDTLQEQMELAKFLAEADLLPKALYKKPANVLLVMGKARAMNLPLDVAFAHIYVIDGKIEISAELLRVQLSRHGHAYRWIEVSDKAAEIEVTLRHDPQHPRTARFTISDATRMGLTSKKSWKEDPESMLVARATTRVVARHCPGVAMGINLSSGDYAEDTPELPVQATAEVINLATDQDPDTLAAEVAAAELYEQALNVENLTQLHEIGHAARSQELLDVTIRTNDGDRKLRDALLRRRDDLKSDPAPQDADNPDPDGERP